MEASVTGQISLIKAYEGLIIEAGVKGDFLLALKALTINPLVNDVDKARAVLKDTLTANKVYLPQFEKWFNQQKS